MLNCESSPVVVATEKVVESLSDSFNRSDNDNKAPVTFITSVKPSRIGKCFSLDEAGELVKTSSGNLVEGIAEVKTFGTIADFMAELVKMTPDKVAVYGVSPHAKARVIPQRMLGDAKAGKLPIIARTRSHFCYPNGMAVLMIDADTRKDGSAPLSDEELLERLYAVWPALRNHPHALWHSSSSFINGPGGQIIGLRGRRVYVLVQDGHDIQRAGKTLFKRLQLAGFGHIEISKSSKMLEKSIIDDTVYWPEHLDFIGGAVCDQRLHQDRPAPLIFCNEAAPIDTTETLLDLSPAEEAERRKLVDAMKVEARPQAQEVLAVWTEARVEARLKARGQSVATHMTEAAALREVYNLAAEKRILHGDFELIADDGEHVLVGDLLDNPHKWHNRRFHDALEPEYGGSDPRICWANLRAAGRPYLHSHAHGGVRYDLHRARREIKWEPGQRVALAQRVLELMRLDGGVFDRGDELVRVSETGSIQPLGLQGLLVEMDRQASWTKHNISKKKDLPCDAPRPVAEAILSMRGDWRLPKLKAVCQTPIMEPTTGRIIDTDGHDAGTGLCLLLGDLSGWPGVPETPTAAQLAAAVKVLWRPFEAFPFVSALDRGVYFSALLTGVIRPALETAPAFMIGSPTAGSGKTLLSTCAGILAGEDEVSPMSGVGDDAEIEKRLLAFGRTGARVLLIDNLTGTFSSEPLCIFLTNSTFRGRPLGVTDQISVPTRMLVLANGNNVTIRGDLCRRVLGCRIDPQDAAPWKRSFALAPAQYCRSHRLELAAAALTIIRAGQSAKMPASGFASFEAWNSTVRRAVCHVADLGLLDVADPAGAVDTAYSRDPETAKLGALLLAWFMVFSERAVAVGEVIKRVGFATEGEREFALKSALAEITGDDRLNPRKIGRWLERKADRIVDEMRFVQDGKKDNVNLWRCELLL